MYEPPSGALRKLAPDSAPIIFVQRSIVNAVEENKRKEE
jgi:hypothetical protein